MSRTNELALHLPFFDPSPSLIEQVDEVKIGKCPRFVAVEMKSQTLFQNAVSRLRGHKSIRQTYR